MADTEREAFEAWLGIKPVGAAHDLAWAAWKAATQHHQSHIEELEQEARLMRARNERLEAELSATHSGMAAIKTLLSRDPCAHANVAIQMIDAAIAASKGAAS